ncbi:excalibur calcium-binding domain-containing protein [Rossellomorea marisflavi]|uniref:excalibur calcium-binding domain-containing protein n=1 Tax=Rossellomorea TaxID=2837508 RepID=UPI0011E75614|nr:excalibur calcium-binding domain-containing protein [Rossellomorea marisflavi]MCM2604166.1 excalibur calcium-binding domain-containing protein [Rossellomorea marisflavi]TYO72767.1 excalibur calcium-binding domain-containing protein [Rossellomorea marisflavi]USK90443.1 excalibur calcium-binding domain-containing protein [Rossellomorea marisflavi]
MKKMIGCALILSLSLASLGVPATEAAAAKKYKNCTELNKDYKGGVARAKGVKNKGGKTKYTPHVSKALYDANKSKDRDKDSIACER